MFKHTSCAITVDLPIDKNINADIYTKTFSRKSSIDSAKGDKEKIWRLINIDYFANVKITGSK